MALANVQLVLILCSLILGDKLANCGHKIRHGHHVVWEKNVPSELEQYSSYGPPVCESWCLVTFFNGLYMERRYDCCKFRAKPGFCPPREVCSWALPYFMTNVYQCFHDFHCPRSYKCCEDSCFLHKVCHPMLDEVAVTPPTSAETTDKPLPNTEQTLNQETTEENVSQLTPTPTTLPQSSGTTYEDTTTVVTTTDDDLGNFSTTEGDEESTKLHVNPSTVGEDSTVTLSTASSQVPKDKPTSTTEIPNSTDSPTSTSKEMQTTADVTQSTRVEFEGSGSGDDYDVPHPQEARSIKLWNEYDDEDMEED